MSQPPTYLPVVIVGARPVGLAAAAHLLERGLEPLVLEQGELPGAAVSTWGHVRLSSPWRYDIDAAARRLLEPTGWVAPDLEALPTGAELVDRYLQPLSETAAIAGRSRTRARILGITRDGADKTRSLGRDRMPYRVCVMTRGAVDDVLAQAVIDTSGTWCRSNPLGVGGLPALGEADAGDALCGPLRDILGADRADFAGRHTLVVGMGHDAANSLLALVELAGSAPGTRITWAIRGGAARRLLGGGTDDELPARWLLGMRLKWATESGLVTLVRWTSIEQVIPSGDGIRVLGRSRDDVLDLTVSRIVNATGFRPDLDIMREIRLDLDSALECVRGLAELTDPNQHSCGTVPPHGEALLAHPDAGFYLAGMKSYGLAPTFLLATGYEQVRSIAAALAGDRAAADRVYLDLLTTGACSMDVAKGGSESSCCGTGAEPQLVTLRVGTPGLGFATGVSHGRAGDSDTS